MQMRETKVEGVKGAPDPGKSAAIDSDLENLQTRLAASQARVTALEQRLRLIRQSRTYRVASRLWRVRAAMRRVFSRRRPRASEQRAQMAAVSTEAVAGDEAPDAARDAELAEQTLSSEQENGTESTQDGQPLLYWGSRGVRATDQEPSGPRRPVVLLGGVTEPQLAEALRALAVDEGTDGEPLVITDCDALRTLDTAGYLYEYIPPREDWERHLPRDAGDYDRFLRRRLASIAGMYGLAGPPPIT
jgi:hypothetical protein